MFPARTRSLTVTCPSPAPSPTQGEAHWHSSGQSLVAIDTQPPSHISVQQKPSTVHTQSWQALRLQPVSVRALQQVEVTHTSQEPAQSTDASSAQVWSHPT